MNKRKINDDEYRIRWDNKTKRLIRVSLKDLEYDRMRKEHLHDKRQNEKEKQANREMNSALKRFQ